MIVNKTFGSQDIMALIKEALIARGYNVKRLELEWASQGIFDSAYCRVKVKLDV